MVNDQSFFAQPIGIKYSFYISGDIEDPAQYAVWFQNMREATENDLVFLHINSNGGELRTAIQFLRSISDCQAPVIGSLEGDAHSAASIIFLACDYYQITPYSTMLCHNYSSGALGKGGELYDQISFERNWSQRMMNEIYQGFLTPKEIVAMLDGKDVWLDDTQIAQRLDKKIYHEQRLYKKTLKEQQNATKSESGSNPRRSTRTTAATDTEQEFVGKE